MMDSAFPEEKKAVRAVRRFCLECQGEQAELVRECVDGGCPLYPWRLPAAEPFQEGKGRALRAVRRHCLICAGDRREARSCDAKSSCPLWDYRFGVLPATYKRVSLRVRAPKDLFLPGFSEKNDPGI